MPNQQQISGAQFLAQNPNAFAPTAAMQLLGQRQEQQQAAYQNQLFMQRQAAQNQMLAQRQAAHQQAGFQNQLLMKQYEMQQQSAQAQNSARDDMIFKVIQSGDEKAIQTIIDNFYTPDPEAFETALPTSNVALTMWLKGIKAQIDREQQSGTFQHGTDEQGNATSVFLPYPEQGSTNAVQGIAATYPEGFKAKEASTRTIADKYVQVAGPSSSGDWINKGPMLESAMSPGDIVVSPASASTVYGIGSKGDTVADRVELRALNRQIRSMETIQVNLGKMLGWAEQEPELLGAKGAATEMVANFSDVMNQLPVMGKLVGGLAGATIPGEGPEAEAVKQQVRRFRQSLRVLKVNIKQMERPGGRTNVEFQRAIDNLLPETENMKALFSSPEGGYNEMITLSIWLRDEMDLLKQDRNDILGLEASPSDKPLYSLTLEELKQAKKRGRMTDQEFILMIETVPKWRDVQLRERGLL